MIVGRTVEQGVLERLLAQVRSGEGRTVVLVGEPGIGKTTLLDWTGRRAGGLTVLRADGRESEADLAFVAIADLLRPIEEDIQTLPVLQARALGSALSLVESVNGDRMAVNAAVLNLLSGDAQSQPYLLLIDDYHWLDSASRGVIDFLARRTGPLGLGLILTTRGPTPPDHAGDELRLEALDHAAALALVGEAGPVDPEVTRQIMELAAGNPLALVELPSGLSEQQRRGTTPLERPLTVSAAVERAFRSRLERLTAPARRAMLLVAEEDTGALSSILAGLTMIGLDVGTIDEAVGTGLLIVNGPIVGFRHPLIRSVVHQAAGQEEIRSTHRLLADAVKDEDQRAWHLAAAAVGADEEAAKALEALANSAMARGAAAPAASALQRAAGLSDDHESRIRRLAAAARAAHRAGNMVLTSTLIDETRTRTGVGIVEPTLLLLDADIRMRRGDFVGACATLRLEAGRIVDSQPHQAATMLLVAAKLEVYRFEAIEAVKHVEQALELVPENERDLVHFSSVAMTATMAGAASARPAIYQTMEAALESAHGHTHTLAIGWPLVWLEEYEQARAFVNRSVELQREGGHLAYLPQALLSLVELDFRTGHWDAARINAAEALRLFEEGHQPTEAAVAAAFLARLEAVCGGRDAAYAHADAARRSDLSSGLRAATAYAEAALGLLELGRGSYSEAVVHLQQARLITETGGIGEPWLLPWQPDLAEALAKLGDKAGAVKVAADLTEIGERLGRKSAIAAGLRCQGLLAADNNFRHLFEQALAIHAGLPTPFELARTELAFGERLRRTKHRVEARGHLRHALSIFEALGAEPWAGKCLAEMAISGETVDRSRPMTSLTTQERQVAMIVASGATNREAAAALFVSPKTIEFHLGNVYRKLGVRSRTELANAFYKEHKPSLTAVKGEAAAEA